jgi:hypothetical protein
MILKLKTRNVLFILLNIIFFTSSQLVVNAKGINNNLQTMDNNHLLETDNSTWKLFREIKLMPSTKDEHPLTLNLGGSIREQHRGLYNLDFGDADPEKDIYAMQRYIVNADLHIFKNFRLYAELSSSTVNGKNVIKASDKDNLGFIQVYADIKFSSIPMQLRVGRQELDFGSGRVLGKKDGPNNGAYYDGVHDQFKFKKITWDVFVAHPLDFQVGVFDNITNTDILIFGSYLSYSLKNNNAFDLYFIANDAKGVKINNIISDEKRYSIGTRFSKSNGSFTYDAEATWQTGTFGHDNISAWQMLAQTGYQWNETRLKPIVQLKASAYSSEKGSTDNTLSLFRPIASKPAANKFLPIGPANFMMLAPNGGVSITKNMNFNLTYYAIWRKNISDGLYSSSLESMIRKPDTVDEKYGRHVANGPYLTLVYEPYDYFAITLNTGILFAGEYLKNTSKGEAVKGLFLKAEYEF